MSNKCFLPMPQNPEAVFVNVDSIRNWIAGEIGTHPGYVLWSLGASGPVQPHPNNPDFCGTMFIPRDLVEKWRVEGISDLFICIRWLEKLQDEEEIAVSKRK